MERIRVFKNYKNHMFYVYFESQKNTGQKYCLYCEDDKTGQHDLDLGNQCNTEQEFEDYLKNNFILVREYYG